MMSILLWLALGAQKTVQCPTGGCNFQANPVEIGISVSAELANDFTLAYQETPVDPAVPGLYLVDIKTIESGFPGAVGKLRFRALVYNEYPERRAAIASWMPFDGRLYPRRPLAFVAIVPWSPHDDAKLVAKRMKLGATFALASKT